MKRLRLAKLYKTLPVAALVAVLLALVSWWVQGLPILRDLERRAEDLRFQLFPASARADTNVVLVAIDDGSLAYVSRLGASWPWPRGFYEGMLSYFAAGGAPRAVLFDLQFTGEDFFMEDDILAGAMRANGHVVQAMQLVPDSTNVPDRLERHTLTAACAPRFVEAGFAGVLSPIPHYLDAAAQVGVINVRPDADGVIRRIPLFYDVQGRMLPQMGLAGLMTGENLGVDAADREGVRLDSLFIPVGADGRFRVNWYGAGALDGPFSYYPMRDIILSVHQMATGREPALPPSLFDGKYIIVGAIAGGLLDLKTTPTDRIFPGMEIWATVLSNYLRQDFVREAPSWVSLLLLLGVCFVVYYGSVRLPLNWSLPGAALVLVLLVAAAVTAWLRWRLLLPIMTLGTGFVITWLFSATLNYMMEGRAKNQIRHIFTRYNHPDVVAQLMEDPESVEMGGEEAEATVLFTDIADFTPFAETKRPRELVHLLNQYFTEFTEILFAHQGMLDKFTGDGVMALFGVPLATPDHALLACRAALEHQRFHRALTDETGAAYFHTHTRVGINTGVIIVGNIGSVKRMDYTAIGDPVNLAARLEGVGKIYGIGTVISESTWAQVNEVIICRELDTLRVKGKDTPTRIFEIIGEHGVDDKPAWLETYHEGLALYRAGDWAGAMARFAELAAPPWSDPAAEEMLDRCHRFRHNPPQDWDGILTLERK
ncbi:MAG: adenylate/guanylate cyclase domain-containing protein [Candidatus Cloacimonetes bacterium]|nr:adenylate/guanylate cyclase domain-containing protein [Candidatus Cloacimonadota bacterium]